MAASPYEVRWEWPGQASEVCEALSHSEFARPRTLSPAPIPSDASRRAVSPTHSAPMRCPRGRTLSPTSMPSNPGHHSRHLSPSILGSPPVIYRPWSQPGGATSPPVQTPVEEGRQSGSNGSETLATAAASSDLLAVARGHGTQQIAQPRRFGSGTPEPPVRLATQSYCVQTHQQRSEHADGTEVKQMAGAFHAFRRRSQCEEPHLRSLPLASTRPRQRGMQPDAAVDKLDASSRNIGAQSSFTDAPDPLLTSVKDPFAPDATKSLQTVSSDVLMHTHSEHASVNPLHQTCQPPLRCQPQALQESPQVPSYRQLSPQRHAMYQSQQQLPAPQSAQPSCQQSWLPQGAPQQQAPQRQSHKDLGGHLEDLECEDVDEGEELELLQEASGEEFRHGHPVASRQDVSMSGTAESSDSRESPAVGYHSGTGVATPQTPYSGALSPNGHGGFAHGGATPKHTGGLTPSTSAGSSPISSPTLQCRRGRMGPSANGSTRHRSTTLGSQRESPHGQRTLALPLRRLFNNSLAPDELYSVVKALFFDSLPRENVSELDVQQIGKEWSKDRFLKAVWEDGVCWSRVRVAWHLCSLQAMSAITEEGICCDEARCACGRYGRGGYVALSAAKANAYADSGGAGGKRHLFMVLALPDEDVVQGERGIRPIRTAADLPSHPTEFCFVDAARLHCLCLLTYNWVPTGRRSKNRSKSARVSHVVRGQQRPFSKREGPRAAMMGA